MAVVLLPVLIIGLLGSVVLLADSADAACQLEAGGRVDASKLPVADGFKDDQARDAAAIMNAGRTATETASLVGWSRAMLYRHQRTHTLGNRKPA